MNKILFEFLLILTILIIGTLALVKVYAYEDAREARYLACSEAIEGLTAVYIHEQDLNARCATFMTLVYAKESGYGQSRMCREDKNCFGIKEPTNKEPLEGVEYKVGAGRFLIFQNYEDGDKVFARLYIKWHLNKTIPQFVYQWSMTDRDTYIWFMQQNYWEVYNYFVNKYGLGY